MASSAEELIGSLQTIQSQYQAHESNAMALRSTVDAQVKNLVADGQPWAVNEMRHLEETWQQAFTNLTQAIDHFHVTPGEIEYVIDVLKSLTMAL